MSKSYICRFYSPITSGSRYLKVNKASQPLKISTWPLLKWIKEGIIKVVKPGKEYPVLEKRSKEAASG
ncbi:MAG: hypothetical protein QXV32_05725 [Conexivisphaerales archaeon]